MATANVDQVKDALARYLEYLDPDDQAWRRPNGDPVTIREMLDMLRDNDPAAQDYLRDVYAAAVRAVRVASKRPVTTQQKILRRGDGPENSILGVIAFDEGSDDGGAYLVVRSREYGRSGAAAGVTFDPPGKGGKSPHTVLALRALAAAMERDNAEHPEE